MERNDKDLPLGVTRVERAKFKGYVSCVYGKRLEYPRYFSVAACGSWDKALEAAIADQRRRAGRLRPRWPRPPFKRGMQRNNKSGVNGVCLVSYRTLEGQRALAYSVTVLDEEGVRRTRRFPLDEYGSREAALSEAKTFRQDWEREVWARYEREVRQWEQSHAY